MKNLKVLQLIIFVLTVLFLFCSSVSAANFYVNNDTTHKDITSWIDTKAVKGDKLIFNTSSYDLNNTIVINKQINIVSYKNTKVNMNSNTSMFDINASVVSFVGLNLVNYAKSEDLHEYHDDPLARGIRGIARDYIKCDIKNTNITAEIAIDIPRMSGNISNSRLTTQLTSIIISKWKGNLINSEIRSKHMGISSWQLGVHPYNELRWVGNIKNSNITSRLRAVDCIYWKGVMSGSRIYSYDTKYKIPALALGNSHGTITKSTIRSNSANAVHVKKTVKITNSKLTAKKGYSKIHRYLPDLSFDSWDRKGKYIYYKISNMGYENSKSCYLGVKYGKTIKKTYIPPIKSGKSTWVKVLVTRKTKITAKIDHYNKIKEENKRYNKISFNV